MKRLSPSVFFSSWCIAFSIATAVYAMVSAACGLSAVSISALAQLAFVSAFCTFLQVLFFTDLVFRKTRYIVRLLWSMPTFLAAVVGCALIFKWFPVNQLSAWFLFVLIFFIGFMGITAAFEIYFRLTGKRYDDLLRRRQQRQ